MLQVQRIDQRDGALSLRRGEILPAPEVDDRPGRDSQPQRLEVSRQGRYPLRDTHHIGAAGQADEPAGIMGQNDVVVGHVMNLVRSRHVIGPSLNSDETARFGSRLAHREDHGFLQHGRRLEHPVAAVEEDHMTKGGLVGEVATEVREVQAVGERPRRDGDQLPAFAQQLRRHREECRVQVRAVRAVPSTDH